MFCVTAALHIFSVCVHETTISGSKNAHIGLPQSNVPLEVIRLSLGSYTCFPYRFRLLRQRHVHQNSQVRLSLLGQDKRVFGKHIEMRSPLSRRQDLVAGCGKKSAGRTNFSIMGNDLCTVQAFHLPGIMTSQLLLFGNRSTNGFDLQ